MIYTNNKLKILYAVQATGNGHIARAIQLLPYLEKYGNVDVFLSGSNSNLDPALPIKYRSKGLSLFYGNRGGLDYFKMWKELNISRIWNEAKSLPVEDYDLVINDFESITSLSCKLKNVKSINFGHQASFISPLTPKPSKRDFIGEWILNHYASATDYIGLHFESYDKFIYSPIIKNEILNANPSNNGHITVYLSHYSDEVVANELNKCTDIQFEVFSKKVTSKVVNKNVTLIPISNNAFNESMISSAGIITGAGFETPAEALFLGKKLLCLPIKGQYEQLCNAAALEKFRVPIIDKIEANSFKTIYSWLSGENPKPLVLSKNTAEIIEKVIEKGATFHHYDTKPFLSHPNQDKLSLA